MLKLLLLLSCAAFTIADHDNVICPDGQSMCFPGMTCCLMASGIYGCCPLPRAVCCQDHVHCCPQSYTCNLQNVTCDRNERAIPMLKHRPSMPVKSHDKEVDRKIVNNVDKNVSGDMSVDNVQCPGGESYCADGNTCCPIGAGLYACCPLPEATCCADKTHCCPTGYKCEPGSGGCVKSSGVVSMMKKMGGRNMHVIPMLMNRPSMPVKSHKKEVVKSFSSKKNVQCSGGESYCADGNTCCPIGAGLYACCPLPEATCCADKTHCCPTGYKCEPGSGGCVKSNGVVSMMKKMGGKNMHVIPMFMNRPSMPVKSHEEEVVKSVSSKKNVQCPGGESYCPDGNTCCSIGAGLYACCPLPEATCCADKTHCCPTGYKCEPTSGGCVSGNKVVSMMKKTAAMPIRVKSIESCDHGHNPCEYDNTCCPFKEGDYGCCPMQNAVCCPDQEHCCPHGFRCNDQKSRCTSDTGISVPYLAKIKPKQKPEMKELHDVTPRKAPSTGNMFCPDRISHCPETFTCCKSRFGFWECCPLPKATCCSDRLHCCPHDTECDVITMKCKSKKYGISVPWLPRQSAKKTSIDVHAVLCPDRVTRCPTGYTCCVLTSGMYGCCPYSNAVCCSDHTHCCPYGTRCNIATVQCLLENEQSWMPVEPASINSIIEMRGDDNIVCPDHITSCPSSYTCCQLQSGAYGCCPYAKAVCCSDKAHCCPFRTICDTKQGKCTRGYFVAPMKKKIAGMKIRNINDVVCPDGTTSCDSGYTCCKLAAGGYGCCPYKEAVCCSDGKHCCPHGTKCNLAAGTCERSGEVILMKETVMAVETKDSGKVVCPGGATSCPSGYTCCKLASGGYGCCPYKEAVCCSDGKHCCPRGTKCNLAAGTCDRSGEVILMKETILAVETKDSGKVVCPGGATSCPSGYTCCKLASGGYGCCPYKEAVCCSDGKHCCPHGTKCNLAAGTCDRSGEVILMKETILAVETKDSGKVVCPGGATSCPSGYTCCKLASGGYGCCPYKEAVCCSDGKHCCPRGTKCNLAAGTCDRSGDVILMKETILAVKTKDYGKVVCPDGATSCPSGYTCCKLASGVYGCCPYKEAVCCSDGKHCCPHGTKCNLAAGTCERSGEVILMKETVMAVKTKDYGKVVCPDGATSCPSGYTCCELAAGGYGCCPYKEAVCCSDGKHCCPRGTKCNLAAGTCDRSGEVILMKETILAVETKDSGKVVCPGGATSCPSGYTCCKLASGGYGCCPYKEAVCCSDGKHCCPHGTKCNLAAGTCERSGEVILMKETVMAVKTKDYGKVVCPDGATSCPSGYTCCKLASGGYGCCPYKEAVCCSDGKHCCPHGTKCNLAAGTCERSGEVILMKETVMAVKTKDSAKVVCPDGATSCPSGYTCCKLASGGYGCCPYKEAVCCSDGKHCCPRGTKCNLAAGTCDRSGEVILMKETVMAVKTKDSRRVVCPDGATSCPSGYTCCKLASGGYGCCPYKEAVCCSDGKHCCPHGTKCNLAAGTCDRSVRIEKVLPEMLKITAVKENSLKKIKASEEIVKDVTCPDKISSCPSHNTCCKLSSGEYGCCPMEHAVCCSDGEHCCPSGTRCSLATSTCVRGNSFVKMLKKTKALTKATALGNTEVVGRVTCPDRMSSCPQGYTCCKLSSGDYGCCPYSNAVCCSDKKHCCPHSTTCDSTSGHCLVGNDFTGVKKRVKNTVLLKSALKKVSSVVCPGGRSQCPDGNTCCPIGGGEYGCCPQPNAVCCSDKKHCCPSGYRCGAEGYCTRGALKIKALQHSNAMKLDKTALSVVCPGGEEQCPNGYTCCPLTNGKYGCCPISHAVCCPDKKHCCPSGYSCSNQGFCVKGFLKVKGLLHIPATVVSQPETKVSTKAIKANKGDTKCPDKETTCLAGTSCCQNKDRKSYSCCPIENAICCPDHIHCCPIGWKCDIQQGTCRRGNGYGTSPLLGKIPGKKTKGGNEKAPKYNYIRFT